MSLQPQPDFTCAICQQVVNMRWTFRTNRTSSIPPFCGYCEHSYTEGVGAPKLGTIRDRREVMRGFAIAEALRVTAARQQWSHQHASA